MCDHVSRRSDVLDDEEVHGDDDFDGQHIAADEQLRSRTLFQISEAAAQRRVSTAGQFDSESDGGDGGSGEAAGGATAGGAEGAGEESKSRADDDDKVSALFVEVPLLPAATSEYQRVTITKVGTRDAESTEVCALLRRARMLRRKYCGTSARAAGAAGAGAATGAGAAAAEGSAGGETPKQAAGAWTAAEAAAGGAGGAGGAAARGRWRPGAPTYNPFGAPMPAASPHEIRTQGGVLFAYAPPSPSSLSSSSAEEGYASAAAAAAAAPLTAVPSADEFFADLQELKRTISHGPVKSVCFKRLRLLEARFNLHVLLNAERELAAQKSVPHRDFYNVRKVDTHVHHSACMNQKHLLRFIKHKLKNNGDEVVIFRDGRFMTLFEVFHSLNLTAYDLSVDTLDMHATNTFHRFDRFNLKYNPCGQSRLREIFLKTDNMMAGRFLAEITNEVERDLEETKYCLAEWRVSIYGSKISEWDKLSRWFCTNNLASPQVRWMIQIPRIYFVFKRSGQIETFQDLIDNIFAPLFAVTCDPSSNTALHTFLQAVVGFDCVDDESKPEPAVLRGLPSPSEWDSAENPPYAYWTYYLWANIQTLNGLRASRGLSTFTFRPHAGEAGDVNHLAATYLCADSINHGILLRKSAGLQYLYYLDQVGLAMSPLSNNKLFLDYHRNPFPMYFARGLNVSLSTDDPLMLHYTKDPLVEEYSVAAQVWKLSSTDVCEIARMSVLQSDFEPQFKRHYIGESYEAEGELGNDIRLTNVPNIRIKFRQEMLDEERAFVAETQ